MPCLLFISLYFLAIINGFAPGSDAKILYQSADQRLVISRSPLEVQRSGIEDNRIRLPALFTNGMVLQRNQEIPVWGWGASGEQITVQFKKQVKKTKVHKNGKWILHLDKEPAGGPFTLTINGSSTIKIEDVLVGDVWICSGQSNMEWPVSLSLNAQKEMMEADYPFIRQFNVPKTVSLQPVDTMKAGDWKSCTPTTVKNFTAVGYFFARQLYNELKVPVGLINANIGGTNIETWISKKAFAENELFTDLVKDIPIVSVEELSNQRMKMVKNKIDSLQGPMPDVDEVTQWKEGSQGNRNWPVTLLPALWENRGWPELDGKVWFKKEVYINASDTGKTGVLYLGNIDDSDESYINGIQVGSTKNKPVEDRIYRVPKGLLKPGSNTVAVRIEDTGGGGGFGSAGHQMKLVIDSTLIPLAGNWNYKIESVYPSGFAVYPNTYPTLLYNAMIHPLIPYAIKGAIWYQGESNASRAFQYRTTFPLMIKDWRTQWGQGDFPFLYVQLSSFNAAPENIQKGSTWAELREAQSMALSLPNTGMAVTIDIGDANDIHPKNKQDVGKRLSLVALNKVYGKPIIHEGPTYEAMRTEGNKAILSFRNAEQGFLIKDRNGYIKGFTIAGEDKRFRYAKAYIMGNSIVVYHEELNKPIAVRYAWADNAADANLFNNKGLPAAPFRTDNWDGITTKEVYRIGR